MAASPYSTTHSINTQHQWLAAMPSFQWLWVTSNVRMYYAVSPRRPSTPLPRPEMMSPLVTFSVRRRVLHWYSLAMPLLPLHPCLRREPTGNDLVSLPLTHQRWSPVLSFEGALAALSLLHRYTSWLRSGLHWLKRSGDDPVGCWC